MANNILNTAELIDKINNAWREHLQVINANSKSMKDLTNSYKLPSNYVQAVSGLKKSYDASDKSLNKLIKTQKQAERQRLNELKLTIKREKAFDKYEKQLEREQRLLDRTTGLYNKVQAGINKLTKQYNDLALRKELGGKLSDEELITLGQLEAKLNKYQRALKQVDANIGKHQRNVGNYKSSFDGLGFSVAQLSREMPAFANSMQTGFMAISNNIPMLVDEINKLKVANRELTASGKPTVSIFKSLGKAVFGWQTLISIGVTLLTVYGAKLIETIFPTNEATKATKKYNEQLAEENKNLKENIEIRKRALQSTKDFINSKQVVGEFQNVLNSVISDSTKAEAVLAELADRLNKLNIGNTDVLTDQNVIQSDRLLIAFNMLEIEKQNIALQEERLSIDEKTRKNAEIEEKLNDKNLHASERQRLLAEQEFISLDKTISIQQRINQLKEQNLAIIGKTVELETQSGANIGRAEIEKIKIVQKLRNELEILKKAYEAYRDSLPPLSDEYKRVDKIVKGFSNTITAENLLLDENYNEKVRNAEADVKRREELEKLQKATDEYIRTVSQSKLGEFGMGSLTQFFDGTFDKLLEGADTLQEKFAVTFNAISEVAKEAFSLINQFGQENFNAQYERLEMQYQFAVDRAGDSATARAEIERQYEQRRKEIQRREAEANKRNALFNIAISTAQGVVSALAMFPPNPILAGIIAGIGATQLALVSSQQIPQFKDGHLSGTYEGLAITNDGVRNGKPVQEFHERNGVVTPIQGKDTLIKMKRGDKIHKDYDSFMNSLYSELSVNGISPFSDGLARNMMPYIENKGMSKSDLKEVMSAEVGRLQNTINNKKEFTLNWHKRGFSVYVRSQGRLEEVKNARVTGKGFSV